MPWQPPARLPPIGDIRAAMDRCDLTLLGHVSPAVARQCFAKLAMAFEPGTKLTGDETRLRMSVWMEACGDLNDALWIDATTQAIQSLKWMPKPAEFRALVAPQIDLARKRRRRLEAMEEAARRPPAAQPFVREPDEVRIRGMRDSFRKVGDMFKAAKYERMLARDEKREPEEWARADIQPPSPSIAAATMPDLPKPSLEMRISLLKAAIAFQRDMGFGDIAEAKERELAALEAQLRGEAA